MHPKARPKRERLRFLFVTTTLTSRFMCYDVLCCIWYFWSLFNTVQSTGRHCNARAAGRNGVLWSFARFVSASWWSLLAMLHRAENVCLLRDNRERRYVVIDGGDVGGGGVAAVVVVVVVAVVVVVVAVVVVFVSAVVVVTVVVVYYRGCSHVN